MRGGGGDQDVIPGKTHYKYKIWTTEGQKMIKKTAEWPEETARGHSTSQTTARRPRDQGAQNMIKDPVDPPYPRHRSLILGAHPPCNDIMQLLGLATIKKRHDKGNQYQE